jgi:hypothetical protein
VSTDACLNIILPLSLLLSFSLYHILTLNLFIVLFLFSTSLSLSLSSSFSFIYLSLTLSHVILSLLLFQFSDNAFIHPSLSPFNSYCLFYHLFILFSLYYYYKVDVHIFSIYDVLETTVADVDEANRKMASRAERYYSEVMLWDGINGIE